MLRALSLAVLLSVLAPAVAEAACPGTPNDCPSPTLNNLTVGGDITIGGSITGAGLSASDVTAADGTAGRTLADRANDPGFSVLETGAKCDGTTDDTTAINAAFATDNKHITIPAGKTCYSATGVTMPANVELSGGSFAFSYPEDVPNNTSMIQCAKDVAACLTIETSPSYGGGMVRNLAVSTDATHASPPTTGACIKINDGYNVTLESVGVFECYDGYYWNGRAGLQIAGFMSHAFSGAIVDAHVVQDTTPELRIQWSRFGINGAQDYHSAAFIRETGGLASQAGILPNGLFVTNTQFNQGGGGTVDHLLEFMNCLSCGPTYQNGSEWIFANDHVENVTNLVYSDASWLSLYGLQFANNLMAASGEAFALNAATAVVNLDLANNELVAGTFHFNSSAAMPSNSLITGNDFIGSVTIDNQYVASKLSVMNFIGNSINQNVTLQGGWKKLNFIGNAWGGTFTNTATGHVTTIPDGMAGRYSAVYSPASDPGSVSIAGFGAMSGITAAGRRLVGIGSSALYNVNNSAQDVVGVGYDAAYSNTSGVSNIAIGSNSLLSNADGYQNVAVGTSALQTTTQGYFNTAVGYGALVSATGSGWNTALGYQAGKSITLGTQNTIIGKDVGSTTLMTGAGNILIGTSSTVDTSASASNNQINIGGAIEANNSTLAVSLTAPTVLAACTSPSVTASNGTWGFAFNVGTSCIGISTATLAIPAAAHGWTCNLVAVTAPDTRYVAQTGGTASTVTLKSYSRATGAGTAFADSDVVRGSCLAY